MQKNVGGLDEGIRITLGPLLVVLSIASFQGTIRLRPAVTAGAFAVGAALTVTGLTQTCPANESMGRNTYRANEELGEQARKIRQRALQ